MREPRSLSPSLENAPETAAGVPEVGTDGGVPANGAGTLAATASPPAPNGTRGGMSETPAIPGTGPDNADHAAAYAAPESAAPRVEGGARDHRPLAGTGCEWYRVPTRDRAPVPAADADGTNAADGVARVRPGKSPAPNEDAAADEAVDAIIADVPDAADAVIAADAIAAEAGSSPDVERDNSSLLGGIGVGDSRGRKLSIWSAGALPSPRSAPGIGIRAGE